jgi:hypothetical protein
MLHWSDRHRRSDRRSLALHLAVARKLKENPSLWYVPLANIARWAEDRDSIPTPYRVWKELLETLSHEDIIKLLLSRSQRATHLRSSSPFTGILDQGERNQIFERFRVK